MHSTLFKLALGLSFLNPALAAPTLPVPTSEPELAQRDVGTYDGYGDYGAVENIAGDSPNQQSSKVVSPAVTSTGTGSDSVITCNGDEFGIPEAACNYMKNNQFIGNIPNPTTSNKQAWIQATGTPQNGDTDSTFNFVNNAGEEVILLMWINSAAANKKRGTAYLTATGDASQTGPAYIAYTLQIGDKVTIYIGSGASGGAFTSLYTSETTVPMQMGLVANSWGEFTAGDNATIDVSAEVKMSGHGLDIQVGDSGCLSSKDQKSCLFYCTYGDTCWLTGSYGLYFEGATDCAVNGGMQAANGTQVANGPDDPPGGGCQGWSNGKAEVNIKFLP